MTLFLVSIICGNQTVQPNIYVPTQRIVNGTAAKPGSWPWVMSLHMSDDIDPDFQICGADLISPHWAITAAHCIYE